MRRATFARGERPAGADVCCARDAPSTPKLAFHGCAHVVHGNGLEGAGPQLRGVLPLGLLPLVSVFFGTPLSAHLTQLGVQTLIICGESTSGCVRATVLDAFSLNYRIALAEEGCFDRSQASHAINLCDMNAKYADVVKTSEVLTFFDSLPGVRGISGGRISSHRESCNPISVPALRAAILALLERRDFGVRGLAALRFGELDHRHAVGELLERRFAVVALDWRGQGGSARELENPRKGHVDDFALYERDVAALEAAGRHAGRLDGDGDRGPGGLDGVDRNLTTGEIVDFIRGAVPA